MQRQVMVKHVKAGDEIRVVGERHKVVAAAPRGDKIGLRLDDRSTLVLDARTLVYRYELFE